ncbi:MAG: cell wall hydrolase [Pseudomonadota bacterium]|nr:cell wall hydrolase [Pseudomonadota bacterium]
MQTFERLIAARTIWGEARGAGEAGCRAVAHVILNRQITRRWGTTLASVCLAFEQFSCWNPHDPNRRQMTELADDDALLATIGCWLDEAADGTDTDPTNGATHYYALSLPVMPAWAYPPAEIQADIAGMRFFTNVS